MFEIPHQLSDQLGRRAGQRLLETWLWPPNPFHTADVEPLAALWRIACARPLDQCYARRSERFGTIGCRGSMAGGTVPRAWRHCAATGWLYCTHIWSSSGPMSGCAMKFPTRADTKDVFNDAGPKTIGASSVIVRSSCAHS
jgi:hypothetical protein